MPLPSLGNVRSSRDANAAWRDVGKENEDGVHLVLNAGNVSSSTWSDILGLALRNLTGGQLATTVFVTSFLPLLGLPKTVLASVPYYPLLVDPSASYTWAADGSTTTLSIWELLWAGAQEIRDRTLEFVASAVAYYVDFWVGFVESAVQFGLWLAHVIQEVWAEEVQPAVEAAGEAFGQMVDWVVDTGVRVLQEAIAGILAAAKGLLDATVGAIVADMALASSCLATLLVGWLMRSRPAGTQGGAQAPCRPGARGMAPPATEVRSRAPTGLEGLNGPELLSARSLPDLST